MIKKLLTLLILCTNLLQTFAAEVVWTRSGAYVDGRDQISEVLRIDPPNKDKIPTMPNPVRPVEPYDVYYYSNIMGWRRPPYKEPIIPGYNVSMSYREHLEPYTRDQFLDVYCTGEIDYKKGMCSTDNYNVYFWDARDWAAGLISSCWKNKGSKKKRAIFLYVQLIADSCKELHDAKEWSELYNIPVYFGTIDSYIPQSWIL